MDANWQTIQRLSEIIRSRRSVRSFTNAMPSTEAMREILESAIFAPYGRTRDVSQEQIRKIFVFSQGTESMNQARELLRMQIRRLNRMLNSILFLLPFLKKKMGLFPQRISAIAENGIPGLSEAAFYIVVAVKKDFPRIEKETIAHTMQNMWLSTTAQGLGFQLLSQTSVMSKNKAFMHLLGLKPGDYELGGCIIGEPKAAPEPRDERHLGDCVVWVR